MKAIQLEEGEIHVRDVDVPEPAPDQARVHLERVGRVPLRPPPRARRLDGRAAHDAASGTRAIGVVEALGPGAERYVAVGDRVILGLGGMGGGYWCGACEYCLSGRPRLCAQAQPLMGTFAEQLCVWAPALVKVPDAHRRRGGAARVRRPHRVQRGAQAASRTASRRGARSRSSARPAVSATTPCRSRTRSATGSSVSTSARTGSSSCGRSARNTS